MDHDRVRELLDDYADAALKTAVHEAVERHLAGCPGCRRELDGLQELRRAAMSLPRSVEPSRDLWPLIAERIAAEPGDSAAEPTLPAAAERRGRSARAVWSGLLAASLALLVVGASLVIRSDRHGANRVESGGGDAMGVESAEILRGAGALVATLAAETGPQTQQLRALAGPDGNLDDESAGNIAWETALIDRAIAELRAAFLENPDDPGLAHRLARISALRAAIDVRTARIASNVS